MKPVAICKNEKMNPHPFFWTNTWIELCNKNTIDYKIVDPYANDFLDTVTEYQAVLWHYSMGLHADLLQASNILSIIEMKGIPVFPNWHTRWYNDDKITESNLMRILGISAPKSKVFYDPGCCLEWIEHDAEFPMIGKLSVGAGSNNVYMLKDRSDAIRYVRRMFSRGFKNTGKLAYKIYSKVQSSHDLKTLVARAKRIPDFMQKHKALKRLPVESDYCYFQEFIPNNGFDIKVVVVGDKLSFICRAVRKGDFRASGGGELYYDKSLISDELIDCAFEAADKLKSQCMGFDFVLDKRDGKPYIIEMSFGFDWKALYNAGGYFDRCHEWHNTPINVPELVLRAVCNEE